MIQNEAIHDILDHPDLIATVLAWHLAEWPKPDATLKTIEKRILGERVRGQFPSTWVALRDERLVGFVVLNTHAPSALIGRPHWIDGVIVDPSLRRTGLASLLIQNAERTAKTMGATHLHALTGIPSLYEKLGWSVVETPCPGDFVLRKELA